MDTRHPTETLNLNGDDFFRHKSMLRQLSQVWVSHQNFGNQAFKEGLMDALRRNKSIKQLGITGFFEDEKLPSQVLEAIDCRVLKK